MPFLLIFLSKINKISISTKYPLARNAAIGLQRGILYTPVFGILLLSLSSVFCSTPQKQGLEARLLPKRGLQVTFDGVPVVRGSSMRFASSDQSRNFYDFSWIFQPHKANAQATELLLGGPNSFLNGSYRMQPQGNTLKFQVQGKWQRADSTLWTLQAGMVWLPAFADGLVYLDGEKEPSLRLDKEGFPTAAFTNRPFKLLRIDGKYASLVIQFSDKEGQAKFPSRVSDPLNHWDNVPPILDLRLSGIALAPGTAFEKNFSMTFYPVAQGAQAQAEMLELQAFPSDTVREVSRESLPILPAPKWSRLDPEKMVLLEAAKRAPESLFETVFAEALSGLWEVPITAYKNVFAQSTPNTLPAEGFYISTGSGRIQVGYADTAGMRHAAYALAFLAKPVNGDLGIPEGILNDYPSTAWRGIHMFVGPEALEFHRQMYEKVLLPWRMNKVVLQCEQTDWTSQPGIKNPITMPLADLSAEASWLKQRQIELIPLIQSFGHMEWFFENGQNLNLATNPEIPYTLDIENPLAQKALKALWEEAITATGAKTLHFGLDEVDMIGWAKKDSDRITQLWEKHLPFLDEIARSHGARMMLWGDMLLAPEETIDFGNAESILQARQRRAVVPEGSFIADWHYKAEADPRPYAASFDALESAGLVPVASTWFYPENIRGFNLAAIQRKLGTLQTTWADFESSEANMLKYLPQFGAYLLSLDYAWSGRQEKPADLPYDATALWAKLFYRHPEPIRPVTGFFLAKGNAALVSCGPLRFRLLDKIDSQKIKEFRIQSPGFASGIALLMENTSWAEENETLGFLTLYLKNGSSNRIPLRYGVHLRVPSDSRPVLAGYRNPEGQTAVYFPFSQPEEVVKIAFSPANPCGSTRVSGMTLLNQPKRNR